MTSSGNERKDIKSEGKVMEGVLCCRFALSSIDMEQRDYDSRTALHVAAAEGELQPRPNLY